MTIRKSLAWSFGQEGTQKAIRFAGAIVVARLLTPEEVGVFSIAMAAAFLLRSFQDLGVNTYLVREPVLTFDKVRTVFGISLVIHWSLALVLLLLGPVLADVYNEPGIADVLLVVVLTFLIGPFGQPASALMRRDMRFDLLFYIGAASVISGTVTTIMLAALGFSYMALAWGMLCGNVVRNGLALVVRRDHLRLRPGMRYWPEVLQFGGWLTLAGFFGTIAAEGQKFVVGGLLNPGAVALVERAQQIPQMSRQALFMPIGRVLLPSFSKNIREGLSIGPGVEMYVAATTAIVWPAFLTIGFLAVPITVLLFGENWRVAGEILPYILGSAAITTTLPQPEQVLTPHGAVRRLAALRFVQVTMALSFAAVGAMHSLELFAMLRIVMATIFIIASYFALHAFMGTTLRCLAPFYGKATLLSVTCAMPALYAYVEYGSSVPISVIFTAFGAALTLWIGGVFTLRHPLSGEIISILTSFRQRFMSAK